MVNHQTPSSLFGELGYYNYKALHLPFKGGGIGGMVQTLQNVKSVVVRNYE